MKSTEVALATEWLRLPLCQDDHHRRV